MKPGNTDVPIGARELGELLGRIGDKWTVPVVVCLTQGPMRYSRLRRALRGISQRMLTLNLRALERDGLVKRTVYPTVPPQVEYELTELGQTLLDPLLCLSSWARHNWQRIELARQRFDMASGDSANGSPQWSRQPLAGKQLGNNDRTPP